MPSELDANRLKAEAERCRKLAEAAVDRLLQMQIREIAEIYDRLAGQAEWVAKDQERRLQ